MPNLALMCHLKADLSEFVSARQNLMIKGIADSKELLGQREGVTFLEGRRGGKSTREGGILSSYIVYPS